MTTDLRRRIRTLSRPELDLPPPFRLVTARESVDAFRHAVAIADSEGAGTLVHVGRFDMAEFAVVLEPDEPLHLARRTFYAGCVALADALLVHAPPEKPVVFEWPDAVRVDGGLVGGARLAWPADGDEAAPPRWLVFGAMIRTVALGEDEPGLHPLGTALEAEGFETIGTGGLAESFARHLMVAVDAWQERGFGTVGRDYLKRLAPQAGTEFGLADNGDLLVRRRDGTEIARRRLATALAQPSWFDPATGGPRR
jgi:hypothetical protein